MSMSSVVVATSTQHPSSAPDNESKSAIQTHGCEYFASATHPGLVALALRIVPLARTALLTSKQFVFEAGPLLIGETEASYQLQKLVIEALQKTDDTGSYGCAVDCLSQMDRKLGRYVPHTTVYVTRTS